MTAPMLERIFLAGPAIYGVALLISFVVLVIVILWQERRQDGERRDG